MCWHPGQVLLRTRRITAPRVSTTTVHKSTRRITAPRVSTTTVHKSPSISNYLTWVVRPMFCMG